MNVYRALIAFAVVWVLTFPAAADKGAQQIRIISANDLYRGLLASELLSRKIVSRAETILGGVRNLVIGDDGQAKALLVEADRDGAGKEFLFRVPWNDADFSSNPDRIVVDIGDARDPRFRLFDDNGGPLPAEFAVSAVIGDYARLRAGQGYGYVRDIVFDESGRVLAVLVTRDAQAGGGTVAFAFPDTPAQSWNPHASYYGLPYVTLQQAQTAALAVDLTRFQRRKAAAG